MTVDIFNKIVKYLAEIANSLVGSVSTSITDNIDTVATNTESIDLLNQYAVWDKIPGNEIETTYYSGVDATNNPSGNKNVATRIYKTNGVTILTQTFAYDADDDNVSIASN